jgi:multiple antibiotic resistance protein
VATWLPFFCFVPVAQSEFGPKFDASVDRNGKPAGGTRRCYAAPVANLSIFVKYFVLAFSALFPVVNPIGSALILLGIVGNAPASVYRELAGRIAIRTALLFLVVEGVGAALLNFFGISLPVVQVAGGLVLAAMGWSLLNRQDVETDRGQGDVIVTSFESLRDRVFYPLTFPVTAGPACIVVMLTLGAHASMRSLAGDVIAHVGILAAVIVLSVVVFYSYAYAPKITERISPQTAHGILRVIAFVLLCIGVQITANGLQAVLKSALKP